jgi:hypothetical protein
LRTGPSLQALRSAIDSLQQANPLLSALIRERKGNFWFEKDQEATPIPLLTEPRNDDNHWQTSARKELNSGFNLDKAPLIKFLYLFAPSEGSNSEIIISFHHAIIDAVSLISLTDQLLTYACENISGKNSIPLFSSETMKLPSFFKGPRLWFRFLPFIFSQMTDELKYRKATRTLKDSAIPSSSDNDLLTLPFTEEETTALVKWARRNKLSLNGIITASMLLVINNQVYGGKKEMLRTVQFANLRPYLYPPAGDADPGCFIAMMRFTVPLSPGSDIVQLATYLDQQYLNSSRRGDKFIFALMGKMLVKKTIRAYKARLGATALSFAGPIRLKKQYGNTELTDIHGYITNNCLGAELTGFGKICFGRLSLDINFLTEEISRGKAILLAEEIKLFLLQLIQEK